MNQEERKKKKEQTEKIIVREEILSNGKKVVHMRKENSKEHAHLEHGSPLWMRTDDN